ncbi:LuxR C-terminal-related transcriptional regulator [Streptomyces sp. NPDC091376]|uniref:LuxR C-terminal-related transcriptional regulator n=1 Tax=Streptomyces sp. NPDC091376 TaxID=3365994 RepID=UPI00380122A5
MQQSLEGRWPFVGRESQIESFLAALGDMQYQSFIIKGGTGVGKTRLAHECFNRALTQGHKGGRSAINTPDGAPLAALAHLLPQGYSPENPLECFQWASDSISRSASTRPRRRFVLLVDQLEYLDLASITLISQLLDSGKIFLLATARFGRHLSEAASSLERAHASRTVEIREFTHEEMSSLVEAAVGGPVTPYSTAALYRHSEGNARRVRELVYGAVSSRILAHDGEIWHLGGKLESTRAIRDTFQSTLDGVGDEARDLLDTIALCGTVGAREFPAETTSRLECAGLVRARNEGARVGLSLVHPLHREMLLCGMPESRKRSLLAQQIARIRARGARRPQDRLNLALWELEVNGRADRSLLMRGMRTARKLRDFSAMQALASVAARTQNEFFPWLLWGEALHELGDFRLSEQVLVHAEELAENERQLVRAKILRTRNLMWGQGNYRKAAQVATERPGKVQSEAGLTALAESEAALYTFMGQPTAAQSLLEGKTPSSNLLARLPRVWSMAARGRATEALRLYDGLGALEAYADIAKLSYSRHAIIPTVFATGEAGRLRDAYLLGLQNWVRIHNLDLHYLDTLLSLMIARCAVLIGIPLTARRWAGQAAAMARQAESEGVLFASLHLLTESALMSGDEDAARRAMAQADALPVWGPFSSEAAIGRARFSIIDGDPVRAKAFLTEAACESRAEGNISSEVRLLTELGRLGEPSAAADRLREISSSSKDQLAAACAMYVSARASGDPKELFSSAHRLEHVGALLLAAEAAAASADAWRRRHRTREATAAGNHAARLAQMCEGAKTVHLALSPESAHLTKREREISDLIVQRLTNAEIAERMKISRRTVENHLQNIYRKLGVASRSELRNEITWS